MPYTDEPLSVVEDLDPEPPPRKGVQQVWELVLGLLVLVGVLGFAGGQWLHQNQQQDEYTAGTQASQRHDWDAAQAHFASASGYLDADKNAQEVATTIAQRDDLYNTGVAYENAGNWAACLRSIRQVTEIESGYKDSAQIEKQAANQVYSDALSGSIVLRPDATPPGLYYYGGAGWTWLSESDLQSKIQGTGTGDWLVYDVAGSRGDSGTTPPPPDSFGGSPQLSGRNLMAAKKTDLSQTVSLSVGAYRYDRFQWGSDGVWAIAYAASSLGNRAPILSLSALEDITAVYQSYSSPATATVSLDSSKEKAFIMDLDPNSNRYLIATWSGEDTAGHVTGSTITNLYLGSAGGDRRLVYTITGGGFMSAQFSPDGRHALLNTYNPLDSGTEKQAILLLTLDGTSPPRAITETTTRAANETNPSNGLPYDIYFTLSAAFIFSGPYAGDMVVAEHDTNHYNLRVIDTARGGAPLSLTEVPTEYPLIWSIFEGRDGQVVLVAREDYFGNDLTRTYPIPVIFVDLSPDTTPQVTRLLVDWDFYHTGLNFATIAGGQLLFSTTVCCDNETATSLFSFPINRFGAQRVRPTTIYSQLRAAGADILSYASQSFGPTLFAYISAGDLHARAYDGSIDLVLEHQVTYMDNPSLHHPGDDRLH